MMMGSLDSDDERVPSYEESVASNNIPAANSPLRLNHAISDSKSPRQPLQNQIATTRSSRIHSVLTAYIEPLLDAQGLNGIAKSTFVLIPSDTLSNLPNLKSTDLAGLPESARNVTVVRLHGPDHQAVFWQQPAVVQQLVSDLKARLAASGHKLEEASAPQPQPQPQRPTLPAGGRSSWLKRSLNIGQTSDPTASTRHWKLGWRSDDGDGDGGGTGSLGLDLVRVKARVGDVSVMTESELGLLLTDTVKGIWLDIEVGT